MVSTKESSRVMAAPFCFWIFILLLSQRPAGSQMPQVLCVPQELTGLFQFESLLPEPTFTTNVEINLRTRSLLQYGQVT